MTSESCDPGDRPQRTVTGISCTSSAGSRSSAAVICASVTDGSAVRVLSGFRLRITENTARSPSGNSGADRRQRGGQAEPLRLLLQHEEARQVPVLQHIAERNVADRRAAARLPSGVTWVRTTRYSETPQRREEEVAEADEAARARRRTGRRVGHRRVEAGSADLVPIVDQLVALATAL